MCILRQIMHSPLYLSGIHFFRTLRLLLWVIGILFSVHTGGYAQQVSPLDSPTPTWLTAPLPRVPAQAGLPFIQTGQVLSWLADGEPMPQALTAVDYQAQVVLRYGRQQQTDLASQGAWSYSVSYVLLYTRADGSSGSSGTKTLQISYATGGQAIYQQIGLEVLSGFGPPSTNQPSPNVQVQIQAVNVTGTVPDDIQLELGIACRNGISMDATFAPAQIGYAVDVHQIWWIYVPGADSYQLEWVYLDAYDEDYATLTNPADVFAAKEPARVITSQTWFDLLPAYGKGKLYFRVRGMEKLLDADRTTNNASEHYFYYLYTPWAYQANGQTAVYTLSEDFEKDKNWQVTTSFAEEGKYKKVISYYDGSLRNRQVLTNLSSENVTLAAETKYDYEGRGVVSVLPVPLQPDKGNELSYQPHLNTFTESTAGFSEKVVYDRPVNSSSLATSSGASQYYSPSNTLAGIHKKYLPDAQGYPYSQTVYTRDNTGRLARQSGVGETFRLKTDNAHVTRFFYGTPTSTELHQLFGSNVGKASHYKKNLAVDPNGQASISYMDQEGRVVATALAGNEPANLVRLASNPTSHPVVPVSLNDNNILDVQAGSSRSVTKILNSNPGQEYTFHYSMKGVVNQLRIDRNGDGDTNDAEDDLKLCADCRYDVQIQIIDPDGNTLASQIKRDIKPSQVFGDGELCSTDEFSAENVTLTTVFADIGEYTVIKELTLSGQALAQLLEETLLTSEKAPKREEFELRFLQANDYSQCNLACEDYARDAYRKEHPGTPDELVPAEYIAEFCRLLAGEFLTEIVEGQCESLREQMVQQLSPNGYYNMLPGWLDSRIGGLTHADGTAVTVSDMQNPAVFKPSWAEALLPLHPEYCHYQICGQDKEASLYEKQIALATTYAKAVELGYMNPLGISGSGIPSSVTSGLDPFFNPSHVNAQGTAAPGRGAGSRTAMENVLRNYRNGLSLWAYLAQNTELYTTEYPNTPDHQWELFRTLYLGIRVGIQTSLTEQGGCVYFPDEDERTIVRKPVIPNPVISGGNTWQNNHVTTTMCSPERIEAAVAAWMAVIEDKCPIQWQPGDREWVIDQLRRYASVSCASSNPLLTLNGFGTANLGLHQVVNLLKNTYQCLEADDFLQNCEVKRFGVIYSFPIASSASWALADLYNQILRDMRLQNGSIQYGTYYTLPDYKAFSAELFAKITNLSYQYTKVKFNPPGSSEGRAVFCVGYSGNCKSVGFLLDALYAQTGHTLLTIKGFRNIQVDPTTGNRLRCEVELPSGQIVVFYEATPAMEWLTPPACDNGYYPCNYPAIETIQMDGVCIGGCITSLLDFPPAPVDCPNCRDAVPQSQGAVPQSVFTPPASPIQEAGCDLILDLGSYKAICKDKLDAEAKTKAAYAYEEALEEYRSQVLRQYMSRCFAAPFSEDFYYQTNQAHEYHYTLYYYDQAGTLVQTVPPEGVDKLGTAAFSATGVYDGVTKPQHRLRTVYRYNSLNQPVYQSTPDGGISYFIYDLKGQLRISQNQRQAGKSNSTHQVYSFTQYDEQGRTTVVGEMDGSMFSPVTHYTPPTATGTEEEQLQAYMTYVQQYVVRQQQIGAATFPKVTDYTLTELTETYYDRLATTAEYLPDFNPRHLRNRVVSVRTRKSAAQTTADTQTFYDYDEHGNVARLAQYIQGLSTSKTLDGAFQIQYRYDLISGKVNQVSYQAGKAEQWMHRYGYDSDNRLKRVHTSRDGVIWEQEASYQYYLHGPLARVELGADRVQGCDYTYTMQGWLKAINTPHAQTQTGSYALNTLDVGEDGIDGSRVAQDEFSMALQYFEGDYTPIGAPLQSTNQGVGAWSNPGNAVLGTGLYNGNIAGWVTSYRSFGEKMQQPNNVQGLRRMSYRYDQLNRLVAGYNFFSDGQGNWQNRTIGNIAAYAYDATFSYDGNGNILTLQRAGATAALIDNLIYGYNTDGNDKLVNNRLRHVKDGAGKVGEDIGNQLDDNYLYDKIGHIIEDNHDKTHIEWNVYRKVQSVTKTDGSGKKVEYVYDGMGNRTAKIITGGSDPRSIFYVRDASGNVMAIYEKKGVVITLTEQPIYGTDRIGTYRPNLVLSSSTARSLIAERGKKEYELKDHLGNVRVVISDLKLGIDHNADGRADTYIASVLSIVDYGAFGENLPGRQFNSGHSRWGFGGKERDSDFENKYDYSTRIYDPQIGRFLGPDDLEGIMPQISTYSFASNNPIVLVDSDGECPLIPLLLKAAANGAADMMLQVAMNYFFDDKVTTFEQAVDKIDWLQVTRSAAEGLIPWKTPGGRLGRAAGTAVGDVIQDFARHKLDGKEYTDEQALKTFMMGILSDLAGGGMGELVAKYGTKKVQKVLKQLGLDEHFCFVAGTQVYTEHGLVSIEDIKEGDLVWSYDEQTGEKALKPVVKLFRNQATQIIEITIDEEVIKATPQHPFFIRGKWVTAGELQVGDTLQRFDNSFAIVRKLVTKDTLVAVYNFEVQDLHSYYVSKYKIIVHNDCEAKQTTAIQKRPVVESVGNHKNPLREWVGRFYTTKSGHKVFVKENGFPDFTPFAAKSAKITGMQGGKVDYAAANYITFRKYFDQHNIDPTSEQAKWVHKWADGGKYKDFEWHHHEDMTTMQLVPAVINNPSKGGVPHVGGSSLTKNRTQ